MRFNIEHTPQEVLDDKDLHAPKMYVMLGDKDVPDSEFRIPASQQEEYEKFMEEVMEGLYAVNDSVTEEQVREFLVSKGYEEIA